jgi:hypothetical protein
MLRLFRGFVSVRIQNKEGKKRIDRELMQAKGLSLPFWQ